MNKTGDNMEKRIRSVKTWLDKAEQAYADDSATKGQLQLMLAQAEMQHLNEKRTPALWQRLGYWPIAVGLALLLGGGYYAWQHQVNAKPQVPVIEQQIQPVSEVTHNNKPTEAQSVGTDSSNATAGSAATGTVSSQSTAVDTNSQAEAVPTQTEQVVETATVSDTNTVQTATSGSQNNETVTAPVISASQIQEAVREGGRSLRGQE